MNYMTRDSPEYPPILHSTSTRSPSFTSPNAIRPQPQPQARSPSPIIKQEIRSSSPLVTPREAHWPIIVREDSDHGIWEYTSPRFGNLASDREEPREEEEVDSFMGVEGGFEEETVLESVIGSPILGKSFIEIGWKRESIVESVELGKSFGELLREKERERETIEGKGFGDLLRESTGERFEGMIVSGINKGIERAISGKIMGMKSEKDIEAEKIGALMPCEQRERPKKQRRDAFSKSLGKKENIVDANIKGKGKSKGIQENDQKEKQVGSGETTTIADAEEKHGSAIATPKKKKKKSSKADNTSVETSPVKKREGRPEESVSKKKKKNKKSGKSDRNEHEEDVVVTEIPTEAYESESTTKKKKKKNRSKKKDLDAISQDIIMEDQTATLPQDTPENSTPKKKKNKKRRISEVADTTDDIFAPIISDSTSKSGEKEKERKKKKVKLTNSNLTTYQEAFSSPAPISGSTPREIFNSATQYLSSPTPVPIAKATAPSPAPISDSGLRGEDNSVIQNVFSPTTKQTANAIPEKTAGNKIKNLFFTPQSGSFDSLDFEDQESISDAGQGSPSPSRIAPKTLSILNKFANSINTAPNLKPKIIPSKLITLSTKEVQKSKSIPRFGALAALDFDPVTGLPYSSQTTAESESSSEGEEYEVDIFHTPRQESPQARNFSIEIPLMSQAKVQRIEKEQRLIKKAKNDRVDDDDYMSETGSSGSGRISTLGAAFMNGVKQSTKPISLPNLPKTAQSGVFREAATLATLKKRITEMNGFGFVKKKDAVADSVDTLTRAVAGLSRTSALIKNIFDRIEVESKNNISLGGGSRRRESMSIVENTGVEIAGELVIDDSWETEGGRVRGNIGGKVDMEMQENIAFSAAYLGKNQESGIQISNTSFRTVTIKPGAGWVIQKAENDNGIVQEGALKVCFVQKGNARVRLGGMGMGVSKGGVWRVRGSEKCVVRNEGKRDAIVVVFGTES